MTDENKFSKLPKWAQEHIRRLEMQVNNHAGRIAELSNSFLRDGKGLQPTDVKIEGWHADPDIPLPSDSAIDFTVTPNNRINVRLQESQFTPNRKVLRIMGNGCDTMLIKMNASNSLEIVFDTERKF